MAADAKSNYLENAVLNHFLSHGSVTSPTTVYLALFTTDPGETNTGTEVSGGSYVRKAITFNTSTTGSVSNTGAITYTNMPGVTVTYWGIYDALSGGNLLYHSPFDTPRSPIAGDSITVPVSGITVSEI
jgi:hypothetical protein